ncbi:MAG: hypothetical protein DRH26_18740, partial [Deltaproteobacteria bacterium]
MALDWGKDKRNTIIILSMALILVGVVWLIFSPKTRVVDGSGENNKEGVPGSGMVLETKPDNSMGTEDSGIVKGKINVTPTIDYKTLEKDGALKRLMENRKKTLGIQKSIDMIVKSDESFIVGASKVSMREILEKAFTQNGEVYQEEISSSGESVPKKIKEYGIYVVRPGDNIWNIHFNILKEYYSHKNILVSSNADEPMNMGQSSGVGKILKFSETIVIIYNLIERQVVKNVNLLEPLSKIVVYNMEEVFSLLEEINYETVDKIQFDGKNIWIP